MTTPTPHERLRAVLLAELNERQWDGIAYAAHGRHKPHRNAGCRVCQADVEAIADLMASTALRSIEQQVREQVAAEARGFAEQFGSAKSAAMRADAATLRWFADRLTGREGQ